MVRQCCKLPDGLVEHTLQVPLGQGRTLQVLVSSDLLGHDQGLVVRDRLHALGSQTLQGGRVFSQVELGADEDDRDGRGMVIDLREPLNKEVSESLCMYGLTGEGIPWHGRCQRRAG